jgi:ribosomal protein L33
MAAQLKATLFCDACGAEVYLLSDNERPSLTVREVRA